MERWRDRRPEDDVLPTREEELQRTRARQSKEGIRESEPISRPGAALGGRSGLEQDRHDPTEVSGQPRVVSEQLGANLRRAALYLAVALVAAATVLSLGLLGAAIMVSSFAAHAPPDDENRRDAPEHRERSPVEPQTPTRRATATGEAPSGADDIPDGSESVFNPEQSGAAGFSPPLERRPVFGKGGHRLLENKEQRDVGGSLPRIVPRD